MTESLSNFSYLKGTNLEKYYEKMMVAEYTCDDFPEMSKATMRMVLEEFLRDMARKYTTNTRVETGAILKQLKVKLPEEIYMNIQNVRINGVGLTLYKSKDKKVDKQPLELLKIMHNIFCCYFSIIGEKYDIPFRAPNKKVFEEHELKKIQDDINLKESQINNLRQKIIDMADKSKNVAQLNKIIIAIKNEKDNQERKLEVIVNNINLHKKITEESAANYEKTMKSLDKLRSECKLSHEELAKKESALVRGELDYQKLKKSIAELDETNSLIQDKVNTIERILELLRVRYEKILELTNRNQDILESIEFTNDIDLKKKLRLDNIALNNELNNEDKFFNQYMASYLHKIEEIESKIKVFKEILNDRIKSEVKEKELYKSFLSMSNSHLIIIYGLIKSWSNYNVVNKSKNWLSKYNICDDAFNDELKKSLEKLKEIDDNQIRLTIYYDLLKMANIQPNVIYKRKLFIKQFDNLIDAVYNMLMPKKDFKFVENKTDSIKVYYLNKFLNELNEKHIVANLRDDLVKVIYEDIVAVNKNSRVSIASKYNTSETNEEHIKINISKKPFEALSVIFDIMGIKSIKHIYEITLEVLKCTVNDNSFGDYDIHVSIEKFLQGPYRIQLFISNNSSIFKDVEEILPLVISEILISTLASEDSEVYVNNYNGMVEIWRKNQGIYNDLFIQREKAINDISVNGIEKVELDIKFKNLTQYKNDLDYAYEKANNEFYNSVIKSKKRVFLPSYSKYLECIEKNKSLEDNDNNANHKNKIFIENLMDKVAKKINKNTLNDIENVLIKEAKTSKYFIDEYKNIKELEDKRLIAEKDIIRNKKFLKEKNKQIGDLNSHKAKLEKQLLSIKRLYLDMHEEY